MARHDYFPIAVLVLISAAISAVAWQANANFLSANNLRNFLLFLSILGLISFAQLAVMILGEIDFSVGPMAGFVVVLSSFWIADGIGTGQIILGIVGVLVVTTLIGFVNGLLIIWLRLPSIVLTLASFFGLQGLSLLLRPLPEGPISYDLAKASALPLLGIPIAALVMLAFCLTLERITFRSGIGRGLRALGSDLPAAFRLGQNRARAVPLVFAFAGLLTGLGGVILAGQIGFGSPTTGINYSLMSITAVVLGGAIISGGRGSFIATLFGAVLVQVNSTATSFLQLGTEWQFWLVGLSTLFGASFYAFARRST